MNLIILFIKTLLKFKMNFNLKNDNQQIPNSSNIEMERNNQNYADVKLY